MDVPGHDILYLLGQGGMATVYLAKQTSLGREVVLKILDTTVNDSPETIERFLNEGRIVASLQHPHIITIYDIGTTGDSVYISMEYVKGGDLKEKLTKQSFTPPEAIDIVSKIASALGAAHARGIIHRDVKPANILFRADGTPLLSDFGIAKNVSSDADLTSTGMFLGSPNYMAPEQAETGPVDRRADIYSLGVIFYEMLTGQKPYIAESVIEVILKHKKAPIPLLPEGLEDYQEMLHLMLAKNRQDRFREADNVLHYIATLKNRGAIVSLSELVQKPDFDVTGEQPLVVEPKVSTFDIRPRRRPLKRALLAALLVASIGTYAGLFFAERQLSKPQFPQVPLTVVPAPPALPGSVQRDGPGGVVPSTDAPDVDAVFAALAWLGHHSLDEYRLTAPPKDNAHYYFSRLLQLDPGNQAAREGLLEIASRYAILAEREIANDNYERARTYIAIGLQVDPNNEALQVLKDLAQKYDGSFLDALARLFD